MKELKTKTDIIPKNYSSKINTTFLCFIYALSFLSSFRIVSYVWNNEDNIFKIFIAPITVFYHYYYYYWFIFFQNINISSSSKSFFLSV